MTKENNLTSGSVFKNLILFSLPYLLSYFLQTLYGMADLFIIGQFGGVSDITAVSIGSQTMHMITVMIVGLAMGTTVTIGRFVGAKNKKGTQEATGNTITMFLTVSIFLAFVLVMLVKPIVKVMSTPEEAFRGTVGYLTICFLGIPFITAYNIISSIFRGMGDSKRPMFFVAVACVANIVLDYIFMGVLSLGPIGAALGTTLSQAISVIISVVSIKKLKLISLEKSNFKPKKGVISQILKIGIPVALQDGFIQIAFLVITVIANRRGLNDAAAVGIVEKVIGIIFLVPSSMLSAVSALAAQNIGADKQERAKSTLWYAILLTVSFGTIVAVAIQFFPEAVIRIFEDDKEVMRLGGQYLKSYVWDCIFAGMHFCFSGYFCAMEKSGISFLHNILSVLLVRIPVAYIASKSFATTLYPMGFAAPLGSILSVVICVFAYILLQNKNKYKSKNAVCQ